MWSDLGYKCRWHPVSSMIFCAHEKSRKRQRQDIAGGLKTDGTWGNKISAWWCWVRPWWTPVAAYRKLGSHVCSEPWSKANSLYSYLVNKRHFVHKDYKIYSSTIKIANSSLGDLCFFTTSVGGYKHHATIITYSSAKITLLSYHSNDRCNRTPGYLTKDFNSCTLVSIR